MHVMLGERSLASQSMAHGTLVSHVLTHLSLLCFWFLLPFLSIPYRCSFLSVRLCLCLYLSFRLFSAGLVMEKESKLRDIMKMMGLKSHIYFGVVCKSAVTRISVIHHILAREHESMPIITTHCHR